MNFSGFMCVHDIKCNRCFTYRKGVPGNSIVHVVPVTYNGDLRETCGIGNEPSMIHSPSTEKKTSVVNLTRGKGKTSLKTHD